MRVSKLYEMDYLISWDDRTRNQLRFSISKLLVRQSVTNFAEMREDPVPGKPRSDRYWSAFCQRPVGRPRLDPPPAISASPGCDKHDV